MKVIDTTIWTDGVFNVEDGEIWFVPYEYNLLCRYNAINRKVEEVIPLDLGKIQVESFNNVYRCKEQVFLIPSFESFMLIYDIETKQFDTVNFKYKTNVLGMFNQSFQYNEWLYLFPANYNSIVRVHIKSHCVEEFPISNDEDKGFYSCVYLNDKIYLVNITDNIYTYDLKNNQLEIEFHSEEVRNLRTIAVVNDKLYLTGRDGKVLIYDTSQKDGKTDRVFGIEFKSVHYTGSQIVYIPLIEKDYILVNDIEKDEIKNIVLSKKTNYKRWPHSSWSKSTIYNNVIYFFNTQYRTMIEYDILSGNLTETSLYIDESNLTKERLTNMFINEIENQGIIREGIGAHAILENFLEFCNSNRF